VDILPVADQIINALDKVYIDKQIATQTSIDEELKFYGEKGDLMEVLGNILDNAYKWSRSRIEIAIIADDKTNKTRSGIRITVEDDGPGIDKEKVNRITQRGVRGDELEGPPGQGIGLSMVQEIVESYSGELAFESSELGGCKVSIYFPAY